MNHRALRIQFVLTSLPVGGAETLLLNMLRKMDFSNFAPEVICLKESGELGPAISSLVPLHSNLISSKWDISVIARLYRLFRERQTDAVITIGAGDKMFWGRLAAKLAGVPVVCSALHSTGWPDGVGRLNRLLTPITSGFIAVASQHAKFMVEHERFPAERVFMIPNGVDTNRFVPIANARLTLRRQLGIAEQSKLVGIVAALRHEKNHLQFVDAAAEILRVRRDVHFVIIGDGPERKNIESHIDQLGIAEHFHLLGSRSDTHELLPGLDVFCLTSRNEANPVSILEALSCEVPVVSPDVGSIHETVIPGKTGCLTKPLCAQETSQRILELLNDSAMSKLLGKNGRAMVIEDWSLEAMVEGYQSLVEQLFNQAARRQGLEEWTRQLIDTTCEQREATPMFPSMEHGLISIASGQFIN